MIYLSWEQLDDVPDELLVGHVVVPADVLIVLVVRVGHGVDHVPHVLAHTHQRQLKARAGYNRRGWQWRREGGRGHVAAGFEVHPHFSGTLNDTVIVGSWSWYSRDVITWEVTNLGPSVDWQEENTSLEPRLTLRVWLQSGGRERAGRIRRTLTPVPGSTLQWQLVEDGRDPG